MSTAQPHTDVTIADLFNGLFGPAPDGAEPGVHCLGGAAEPLYLPAAAGVPAQLHYSHDHAASALHEISHWCIASPARRALPDFGYRYLPAPRTRAQQSEFLRLEVGAQALERCFAELAGVHFNLSFDDLNDEHRDLRGAFSQAVEQRYQNLHAGGMSARALRFAQALACARPAASQ